MEGLYKKLLLIQTSVENFVKNKQGHNYTYVDGNTVLNHIRPLMNDTNLLLKQEVLSIKNERYDYTTSKGNPKTEVLSCVEMRFTWIDCETGEKDENLFGANGMNDFDKGVGSALTYAERYFLLKYFHIPTDKDDVDALPQRDTHTVIQKTPLQIAIDEMSKCTSLDAVKKCWTKNKQFQTQQIFIDAKEKMKASLQPVLN
jgi:hypothetical protein